MLLIETFPWVCPGLLLSGETGAGKSIVIGALGLLLGDRATTGQIRQGEERALMEAIFAVEPKKMAPLVPIMEEAGLPLEDELILSREIFSSGRSVSRVNGRAVPLFLLKN